MNLGLLAAAVDDLLFIFEVLTGFQIPDTLFIAGRHGLILNQPGYKSSKLENVGIQRFDHLDDISARVQVGCGQEHVDSL
ncbi:hypothetical protein CVT25_006719 [Psilocybe cyanescens]|uniref:Uncharacterized protein n=1 Tax=Psilocybe cyanescens TaxID=93625 RepID=A0A409XE82_PSICY|nr:hypothetical protein CVT25_006719 [Psilocybe cyanescens]